MNNYNIALRVILLLCLFVFQLLFVYMDYLSNYKKIFLFIYLGCFSPFLAQDVDFNSCDLLTPHK